MLTLSFFWQAEGIGLALLVAGLFGARTVWRTNRVAPLLYALGGGLIGAALIGSLLGQLFVAASALIAGSVTMGSLAYLIGGIALGTLIGGGLGASLALRAWARSEASGRRDLGLLLGGVVGLLWLAARLPVIAPGLFGPGPAPAASVTSTDQTGFLGQPTPAREFAGHTGRAAALELSADGRVLASGDRLGRAILWDAASGAQLRALDAHQPMVSALALSRDGRTLVTGGAGPELAVWDVAAGKRLRLLQGPDSGAAALLLVADDRTLIAAGADGSLRAVDIRTGEPLQRFVSHTHIIYALALSPDGRTLVSGDGAGSINVWDTATGGLVNAIATGEGPIMSLVLTAEGGRVISNGYGRLSIWRLSDGERLDSLNAGATALSPLRLGPDGDTLIFLRAGNLGYQQIGVWRLSAGQAIYAQETGVNGGDIGAIALSPDGRTVFLANTESKLAITAWEIPQL